MNAIDERACGKPGCDNFGKPGLNIVGHGWFVTKSGRRRRYRCTVCGGTLSTNTGTAYRGLRCSRREFDQVASLRVEGVSISATARVTGHSRTTIARWLERAATAAACFNRCFRHQLLLPHPYLVLTKPLRLDIQCQRAASVKIGWKYLDDYGLSSLHQHLMTEAPRNQRGAPGNPPGRFEVLHIEPEPDETCASDDTASARGVPTLYFRDASRSIISSNTSPDVPFDRSVNPYRGCEHGCSYCYARPTHEYLGLSAGLDFETRIFVKPRAPDLLRAELSRRSWTPQVLAMSGVTDPYQPIERQLQLTRGCRAVLAEFRNPVGVITKSALVTRDLDLLAELATHRCVSVTLSVTTLEEDVRRAMEPRASTAERRFEAITRLRDRGVPAGVNIAPVVPGLTDHEIVPILRQAAQAGAQFAHFIVLRLPYGVKDLFEGIVRLIRLDPKNLQSRTIRLQVDATQRWTPSFGQLSGQVKVDSRFMFLSRFRLR